MHPNPQPDVENVIISVLHTYVVLFNIMIS